MLEFIVGYDVGKFKEYYSSLSDLQAYYKTIGTRQSESFKLDGAEKQHIGMILNLIPIVVQESPGLKSMKDLPVPRNTMRYWRK